MSILLGSGTSGPSKMFFGNNPLKEVWVGSNKIWPTGPTSDAAFLFNFNDQSAPYRNLGSENKSLTLYGSYAYDHDHVYIANTGRFQTTSSSNWFNGFTVSMWTRDAVANSNWRTLFHRAPASGTLNNETYIVQNSNASATSIHAGLRLNGTVKEFVSNFSPPINGGWFHTAVVWARASATAYTCTFYINGVQRGSFNATGFSSNVSIPADHPLYIGAGRDNDGFEWSGRMDDLIIWDRPLSAAEVTTVYNSGRSWVPRIYNAGPLDFTVNEPGGMFLTADFTPTSWSATGLPNGITLGSNGYLSGTVTATGSGTMIVTATDGTNTATKSISWTATEVPNLPNHSIMTSGANKVSHNGWARPALTWKLVNAGSGAFSKNGTLATPRGRGRIRFIATLTNGRNTRIVSDQRGVLATGSGTNQNYRTDVLVTNVDEGFYIEVENYSSNTSDSFLLATDQS